MTKLQPKGLKPVLAMTKAVEEPKKAVTLPPTTAKTQEGASKKSEKKKLPSDAYVAEVEEQFSVTTDDDSMDENKKDYYFKVQVIRQGDLGLPRLNIRRFLDYENKTNPEKSYHGATPMGINMPIEAVYDLRNALDAIIGECEKKSLI